jgi:hypothetical protein
MLDKKAHVWRPYLDDPAAMLEQRMDLRGWVASGLLTAEPPDQATLDEQVFAAADAGDWSLAYALAVHHTCPRGVRMFLDRMQQPDEEEVEEMAE